MFVWKIKFFSPDRRQGFCLEISANHFSKGFVNCGILDLFTCIGRLLNRKFWEAQLLAIFRKDQTHFSSINFCVDEFEPPERS